MNLIENALKEDGYSKNLDYFKRLPRTNVECKLFVKSDLYLSGLNYFFETFNYLSEGELNYSDYLKFEGKEYKRNDKELFRFELPFNVALTGERVALNLLHHSSAISTQTKKFVDKVSGTGVKILDTRKTTPGLRELDKYAVKAAGGFNHRMSQVDMWMVKDNHKEIFGGVEPAINFFESLNSFYTPLELEVHNLDELQEAIKLGVKHIMLDNFKPDQIRQALKYKTSEITLEISGGITLDSIKDYLIEGVDAISVGSLTNGVPRVDLSLKLSRNS